MSGWQFPQWNYGYTQMPSYPPHPQYYQQYPGYGGPPHRFRPPAPPTPSPAPPPPSSSAAPVAASSSAVRTEPQSAVIKKDPVVAKLEQVEAELAAAKPKPAPAPPVKPEEGEIVEKSILGILRGRNPVMFCNDQSKMRGLHMEWQQVRQIFFSDKFEIFLLFR